MAAQNLAVGLIAFAMRQLRDTENSPITIEFSKVNEISIYGDKVIPLPIKNLDENEYSSADIPQWQSLLTDISFEDLNNRREIPRISIISALSEKLSFSITSDRNYEAVYRCGKPALFGNSIIISEKPGTRITISADRDIFGAAVYFDKDEIISRWQREVGLLNRNHGDFIYSDKYISDLNEIVENRHVLKYYGRLISKYFEEMQRRMLDHGINEDSSDKISEALSIELGLEKDSTAPSFDSMVASLDIISSAVAEFRNRIADVRALDSSFRVADEFQESQSGYEIGKSLAEMRELARRAKLPKLNTTEIWASRRSDDDRDAITFMRDIWGNSINQGIVYQDDISRQGDTTLVQAVRNRFSYLRRSKNNMEEIHKLENILPPPASQRAEDARKLCPENSSEAIYYDHLFLERERIRAVRRDRAV